jgi:hypothetical protein
MENWTFSRNDGNPLFKSFYSSSSVSQLGEFKNKLISARKPVSLISIPSWKVFRNQVKSNVSPVKLNKPRFECYSDAASFRTNSPKGSKSPLWKSRIRQQTSFSSVSVKSSPKNGRGKRIMTILRNEELVKAAEVLADMDESDLSQLPGSYLKNLAEFCSAFDEKYRRIGY